MSLTIRQQIIENLQSELSYITPNAGYKTKIKNVFVGYKNLSSVRDYPSITFYLGTDIVKEENESATLQLRELDLVILGYLEANTEPTHDGNLTAQIERLYSDLSNFFYNSSNISPNYSSTLLTINGVQSLSLSEKQSYIETTQNKCVTGILLKVIYLEDPCNLQTDTFSATTNLSNA